MDIDKVVDRMILEDCGFPKEVIAKITDLDALINEAKAIADQGKAEKILQFLGMDVSELGGDVLDKTAVALDKLIDWVQKKAKGGEEMSPELAKMKAAAEKRRGKKIEGREKNTKIKKVGKDFSKISRKKYKNKNESLTPEEEAELDALRRGMAFITDNDARQEAMDRIKELQGKEDNPCPTPGSKIRSRGRGRGMATGKGRGPVGRMNRDY